MGTACFSETLASTNESIRRQNPEPYIFAVVKTVLTRSVKNLLDNQVNAYNTDKSGFPLNNKPLHKVFAGFNSRETYRMVP
jgi:hypothetical protein